MPDRTASVLRIAAAAAVCAGTLACSSAHEGETDSGTASDASAADAALPMDGASPDAGAPAQFCPDTLVRRSIAEGSGPAGVRAIQVVSTATQELVTATFGDLAVNGELGIWAVDRSSGATVELARRPAEGDAWWQPVSSMASSTGASVLVCTSDRARCDRFRWAEGAASAEIDAATMTDPGSLTFARREDAEDVLLRVVRASTGVQIERYAWPAGGSPSEVVIQNDELRALTVGPYFAASVPARTDDAVAIAIADETGTSRVVWMDARAEEVVSVLPFHAEGLAAQTHSLVSLGDGSLGLVVDDGSGLPRVARVTRDAIESVLVTVPFAFTQTATGSVAGAYVAGMTAPMPRGGDGPQQRSLHVARVRPSPFTVEGGDVPWFSGGCSQNALDITVPPVGGLIVASSCGVSNVGISLTYACVPGVR